MTNKRLLIKYILSNNDECSFFDKKVSIDIKSEKGKAKLLKHICALSNSNPENDSFIVVGVSNDNEIIGTCFIDDADIQNILHSGLKNPPSVIYENISFPNVPKNKSVGILTIRNRSSISSFLKRIDTIESGTVYHRIGSKSVPSIGEISVINENKDIVDKTYKCSQNNIKELIDSVFDFFRMWGDSYNPTYLVFKEQFVVCWAGYEKDGFYGEVDIQIVNEGTRLFFSGIHDVKINITEDSFNVLEFLRLGYNDKFDYYPTFSTTIIFNDNGTYKTHKVFIFKPPLLPNDEMLLLYKKSKELENEGLVNETLDNNINCLYVESLANYYFLCYLNGIDEALHDFINLGTYLDGAAAECHSELNLILEIYEKTLADSLF